MKNKIPDPDCNKCYGEGQILHYESHDGETIYSDCECLTKGDPEEKKKKWMEFKQYRALKLKKLPLLIEILRNS